MVNYFMFLGVLNWGWGREVEVDCCEDYVS